MSEHPYLPGKALILSRLPAQDWFSLDEAAEHSGWSRSFIRDRVKSGELPAQEYQKPFEERAKRKGTHRTYRIHVDDLVVFIMKNSGHRYSEEKPFRDVVGIIRSWPRWMVRELQKALNKMFPVPGVGTAAGETAGSGDAAEAEKKS